MEGKFRNFELDKFKEILNSCNHNCVISTGGGLGANEDAIKLIKDKYKDDTIVVWINIPFNVVKNKLSTLKNRPLIKRLSINELKELYNMRKQKYSELADIVISNNWRRKPHHIVSEIINKVKQIKK